MKISIIAIRRISERCDMPFDISEASYLPSHQLVIHIYHWCEDRCGNRVAI